MAKTEVIPNGLITFGESKATCPHCERDIPIEEIDEAWHKSSKPTIKLKCKCKRLVGITSDIMGDFISFEL